MTVQLGKTDPKATTTSRLSKSLPNLFGPSSNAISVMDNTAFVAVVGDAKNGLKQTDVFANDKVMQWATKYAGNRRGFLKDLPEAYTKTMALGSRYTGGKVGSLLEQDDTTKDRLVVLVLDQVTLEGLVGFELKVVPQRLQRRLQMVQIGRLRVALGCVQNRRDLK